jgi:hypothetical protein
MAMWLALATCAVLGAGGPGAGTAAAQDRPVARAAGTAASGWDRARQVPGTEPWSRQASIVAEHSNVNSGITSVACPARGDCAVSGGYVSGEFNFLVFAGAEHAGKWARAGVLPGDAALVGDGGEAAYNGLASNQFLSQVACSSPGNCAVAGNYQAAALTGESAPLLGIERGGRWGQVRPLRGAASALLAVSCPRTTGHCAAGGSTARGAFVLDEQGAGWDRYQKVADATGPLTTMSCPAVGTCLAGGAGYQYDNADRATSPGAAFIVSESNGRWAAATPVPGLRRLTTTGSEVDSVSCVAAGDCTLLGDYDDQTGDDPHVFVADERRGRWGQARLVPGLAALDRGHGELAAQVSCGSVRLCVAGGSYLSRPVIRHHGQAWVATEIRGHWQAARKVPGTSVLNTYGYAVVTSVSCSAATCVAGGWYTASSKGVDDESGFLVTWRGGTWRRAVQVPGLARLNTGGNAQVTAVSCAPTDFCGAVGDYYNGKAGESRMFEVTGTG